MPNLKTYFLAFALLGMGSDRVLAQDATPALPPGTPDIKMPSQAEIDKYTKEMERMSRAGTNPAYLPLFEAFDHFTRITPQIPKSVFISPLSGVSKFLETPDLKAGMAKTRNWLNTFNGPDPNFSPPQTNNPFMGMMGSFALLTSGMPLEAVWASETRVALANGKNDLAIQNFDETMRFGEALSMDGIMLGLVSLEFAMKNPIVYAHALPGFTLRQCNALERAIARASNSNAWERGLEKSMREEQESAMDMIEDDGSVFDLAKQGVEIQNELEANGNAGGEVDFDISKQLESLFAPRTKHSIRPTPEALAKRQIIAGAVEEDYTRVRNVLHNPFASIPPKPERPAWIETVRGFSFVSFLDAGVLPELQKPVLQLKLLAAHTAIRKFRWNHDRLPNDLNELEAKNLTTDPTTGKPFLYKTDGETYTLMSAGVSTRDNMGKLIASTTPYDLMTEPIPEFGTLAGMGGAMYVGVSSEIEGPPINTELTGTETAPGDK